MCWGESSGVMRQSKSVVARSWGDVGDERLRALN